MKSLLIVRTAKKPPIKDHEGVLMILLEALFVRKRRALAYVRGAGGIEARLLKLGVSNETHIVVEEGLKENEEVTLYEPADIALPPAPDLSVAASSK